MTHALRYVDPTGEDQKWDPLRFWWAVCDSGILRLLSPAEVKVLVQAFRMADRHGEVDLPRQYIADRIGYGRRAVRDAIKALEDRRLLQLVGRSRRASRSFAYRLVEPAPDPAAAQGGSYGGASGGPDADPATDVRDAFRGIAGSKGERQIRQGGSYDPQRGKLRSPKECKKEFRKESSSNAPPLRAGESSEGGGNLFEPPAYDAAAAAALRVWGRFDRRVAHGLVSQHRPTRRQVLQVLANAYALKRDGKLRNPDPCGFIRRAIQRGEFTVDERVLAWRRRRRAASEARVRERLDRETTAERNATEAAQADQAAALLDAMTEAERHALYLAVIAGLPAKAPRPAEGGRIARALMIARLNAESTEEGNE